MNGHFLCRRTVLIAAALIGGMSGCSSAASTSGLAVGYGRLSGHIGPGAPPDGTTPNIVLSFSSGNKTARATETRGTYTIDLPAGVWDVRSPAGVCATGIRVIAGAWQRDDLAYPTGQCQSLEGPPTPATPPPPPNPITVPVESGYGMSEPFCAIPSLSGRITYEVIDGEATLLLNVRGLPHDETIGVDWLNNNVRGYLVATFATDGRGGAIQESLRIFRPGEVKGLGLVLTTGEVNQKTVGRLRPC